MIYIVIDSPFNRANYPDLIDTLHKNPPSYCEVNELPDPYRKYSCWNCDIEWTAKIEMDKNSIHLSGEKSQYCPNCNKIFSAATQWVTIDGNPFPFPKPEPKLIK